MNSFLFCVSFLSHHLPEKRRGILGLSLSSIALCTMLNPLGMPGGWSHVETCPGDCTLALKVHSDTGNKIRDDLQQAVKCAPLANLPKVNRLSVKLIQGHACCQFTENLNLLWVSGAKADL